METVFLKLSPLLDNRLEKACSHHARIKAREQLQVFDWGHGVHLRENGVGTSQWVDFSFIFKSGSVLANRFIESSRWVFGSRVFANR